MRRNANEPVHDDSEIEVMGTLVRLHKQLKPRDIERVELNACKKGIEMNTNPTIIIDFISVTSIQEDFKDGGTIIIDAKTACIVVEPMEEVLAAWRKVKEYLEQ